MDLKEFNDKLIRWSFLAPKEVKKAITMGAELIRREVQENHLSGPKMPRGTGDEMNATLAVQSGMLRRSIAIRVMVAAGEIDARIGTNIPYGRKHELGLNGMPERPFLRPSLSKKRTESLKLMEKAFLGAYGRA